MKRTVSFVVPHESQCQDGAWIDLPPMLSPRVNHGLVEAGKEKGLKLIPVVNMSKSYVTFPMFLMWQDLDTAAKLLFL